MFRITSNTILRIVSWNVKGLGNPVKRARVLAHLKQLQPDIICLQETHTKRSVQLVLRANWLGQAYNANFGSKARGVYLFRKNIPFSQSAVIADPEGRFLLLSGDLNSMPVTFVNIYGPNFDSPEFFQKIFKMIPNLDSSNIIIAGDMNLVMDTQLDKSSTIHSLQSKSSQLVKGALRNMNILDTWRSLNPTGRAYSFFSPVHGTYSRIDYIFLDSKLIPLIKDITYHPILVSDHGPVSVDLDLATLANARRRNWRFDPTLLKEDFFLKKFEEHILTYIQENDNGEVNDMILWEGLKAVIRGQVISFTAAKRISEETEFRNIETKLQQLEQLYQVTPSIDLLGNITKLRSEYNYILNKRVCLQITKCKQNFFEYGDKPHKLLARVLRKTQASQTILSIDKNGEIIRDPQEINECFKDFYCDLYSSKCSAGQSIIQDFLEKCNLPKLDSDAVSDLDADITLNEIKTAISQLPNNKAPGPDGFGAEFYKAYSAVLAPLILRMFNHAKVSGTLPSSLYHGVISLILKKDRDPLSVSSYRPISLLCVETKILTKILSTRLKDHITKLIHSDQTGFIPKRHIYFNMRRLFNLMYSTARSSDDSIVIALDAEKAFDQVEWPYMFAVLSRFGFGDSFINWIRILYKEPTASVLTNNNLSTPFRLYRGTRQGDPISPFIFALVLEPLAARIRLKSEILPIIHGNHPHKFSAYADDVVLFVSKPKSSIDPLLQLINEFGLFSGYKVNWTKSELMPLSEESDLEYLGKTPFRIVKDKFESLGITVSRKLSDLLKLNWTKKINQLQKNIEFWNTLPISMVGRVNAVKMIVLPRFLYIFQSIPVCIPQSYFQGLESILLSFIWSGKVPRISKKHLMKSKGDGGLGLPNFKLYYMASHLNIFSFWRRCTPGADLEGQPSWLLIEHMSCKSSCLPALLNSPANVKNTLYDKNPIIQNSLKVWNQILKLVKAPKMYLDTPICNNHAFKPGLDDITFATWREKGLSLLKHFYIDGRLVSFQQLRDQYNLPNSHFFRFLQIRHFLRASVPNYDSIPQNATLDSFLSVEPYSKGAVSHLYRVLLSLIVPTTDTYREQWQEELGERISADIWHDCVKNIYNSSVNARHSLIQFKILHRLHFSPTKLKNIYQNVSGMCAKCLSVQGTLSHLFVHCHKLQQFWGSIFDFVTKAIGRRVLCTPITILFGVTELGWAKNKYEVRVISMCTLLARKMILLCWKSDKPPSFDMWLKELGNVLYLEKIRYTLSNRLSIFHKTWKTVISLLDNL